MQLRAALGGLAAAAFSIMSAGSVFAQSAVLPDSDGTLGFGAPAPGAIGFQTAVTDIMSQIAWFEIFTLWFIVPITLFVLGLLIWVAVRYNAKSNPTPSRTSHNTVIEVLWTLGPIVILLALAIPSFQLLSAQYDPPEDPAVTVKAVGYQWYWGYEYQTDEEIIFDSNMLSEDDAERERYGKLDRAEYPRLLAVDNEMVVPVNKVVRVLVTADPEGVNHAFAVPAFGVKMDAIPGRNNEIWFKAEQEGLYYGQCSELCGARHAFMSIAVRVVSEERYAQWLAAAADDLGAANENLLASLAADRDTLVANNN
ncbi:MAG: cytochrome c oxidase subunit II [Pseudomonadota bacterium]